MIYWIPVVMGLFYLFLNNLWCFSIWFFFSSIKLLVLVTNQLLCRYSWCFFVWFCLQWIMNLNVVSLLAFSSVETAMHFLLMWVKGRYGDRENYHRSKLNMMKGPRGIEVRRGGYKEIERQTIRSVSSISFSLYFLVL